MTISIKTKALMDEDKILTVHAYTKGLRSYELDSAIPAKVPIPEDIKNHSGDRVWPENLSKEEVFYVDTSE